MTLHGILPGQWPDSEFVVIDEAGHSSGHPGMSEALVVATDRFASLP
jgi:proline iminopeptidase